MTYRIGSLCSGYEGLGMAVQAVFGGDLAWVADNDPGAATILAHRFPSVPNHGDISKTDWSAVEPVDIACMGFPCTDVSAAGARAGLRKGNRSGVWHHCADAIRALRPPLVIIENVRGLLTARGDDPTPEHLAAEATVLTTIRLLQWLDNETNLAAFKGDRQRVRQCRARTARLMGLRKRALARCQWHEQRLVRAIGTVLGSLADLGYDAQWVTVSASEVGAPHRRGRVFIVAQFAADTPDGRRLGWLPGSGARWPSPIGGEAISFDRNGSGSPAEDPNGTASREWGQPASGQAGGGRPRPDAGRPGGAPAADTCGEGLEIRSVEHHGAERPATERSGGDAAAHAQGNGRDEGWPESARFIGGSDAAECGHGSAADAPGGGWRPEQGPSWRRGSGRLRAPGREPGDSGVSWGSYGPAIRRWETVLGRPTPRPTEPGRTGERLSPAFVEFLMGLPEGWVTDVPGLSRNQKLHALGNGVVPQQAAMALRLLLGAIEAGEAA